MCHPKKHKNVFWRKHSVKFSVWVDNFREDTFSPIQWDCVFWEDTISCLLGWHILLESTRRLQTVFCKYAFILVAWRPTRPQKYGMESEMCLPRQKSPLPANLKFRPTSPTSWSHSLPPRAQTETGLSVDLTLAPPSLPLSQVDAD